MRSADSPVAQTTMKKALRNMNLALHEYANTHRVSKLLAMYEGLAWDTYAAVELAGSVRETRIF